MTEHALYIPIGLHDRYTELAGETTTPTVDITKLCQELVGIYTSNSMKTFWSPIDLIIGHIVMSNHLLNGIDSRSLIKDITNHELVFSHIDAFLTECVTQSNRKSFNESVEKFEQLSKPQRDALTEAIKVCIVFIDEPSESTKITTDDARRLYAIVQILKTSQPNDEWIKLRLNLVVDMLDTEKV